MKLSIIRAVAAALAFSLLPAGVADAQSGSRPAPAVTTAVAPVNVNTATAEELVALPGIGPSRAAAIVELRQKIGGFKKLEDLMRVKGIGRKTFRKLEPMLKL